jgi:DNA-binding transcriptional MerR regulator
MKYADFTLTEIGRFFKFRRSLASAEDCENIEQLLEEKKLDYEQKIRAYLTMLTLVDKMLQVKSRIASPDDMLIADELIISVFSEIRESQHEK